VLEEIEPKAPATAIAADLARPGEAERLAREASAVHGRIDLLINNAGVGYFALLEEATEERIRGLFEINTFAPLLLIREALPALRASADGRIVNIVSSLGRVPVPSTGVYGGSKTALAVLGNVLRLEVEPTGLRVINVYPGTLDTEFEKHAEREAGRLGLAPGGGVGRPAAEVAEEILDAAAGKAGEVWLEKLGRTMAADAILHPVDVDRQLAPLRDRLIREGSGTKPAEERLWRRWRVEISLACDLRCARCPGKKAREAASEGEALMADEVWASLHPHLGEVGEIDFSGGGEPLLHPRLADWIAEAREAGARAGFQTNGAHLDEPTIDRLLAARPDWIALTLGGTSRESYERARPGLSFETFEANAKRLADRCPGQNPVLALRLVMRRERTEELEEAVRLASDLGFDRVEFTHCDVIRDLESGRPSLFGSSSDKEVRALEKALRRARRKARRLGLETDATAFVPEEQAVCVHDPRHALFVRHDGRVAPCANLAIGGRTCFLDTEVTMPASAYGRLGEADLLELWRSPACREYRDRFERRVTTQEEILADVAMERSLSRLHEATEAAREAMPEPPDGCRSCRHLYDL
jgi:short-subunit dehydrogenase/MoaA/NifB/PqqE/SkfB family radical SAM enzyme